METKKYILKYKILLVDSYPILDKEIKIDNCLSELHAKSKLEDYLKKKYINFKGLIVESCKLDPLDNLFNFDLFKNNSDFNNIFDSIFKPKNK